MTIGALAAVSALGLTIPRDLALVGFDDMEWAEITRPSLTSLAQPTYDVGHLAATLLARRIAGNVSPPTVYSLQADLKIRQSSLRP
jgi:LacI family transcriptional regulator